MLAKKTKEKALQCLRSGDTAAAIQLLRDGEISDGQRRSLTLIEAEYSQLQMAILKGVISEDQRRSRTNQINDRLLNLLRDPTPVDEVVSNSKAYLLAGAGVLLAGLLFLMVNLFVPPAEDCPDFSEATRNRLLILPFEQLGQQTARPHLLLRDRIEALVRENELSTSVGLGSLSPGLSAGEAPAKATDCGANAIVWGKYSVASDSIHLVLQYHFIDQPEAAAVSELISLRDVTALHNGQFSQGLEDAIFALCAVIALRDGKLELARNWLARVEGEDNLSKELRELLDLGPG